MPHVSGSQQTVYWQGEVGIEARLLQLLHQEVHHCHVAAALLLAWSHCKPAIFPHKNLPGKSSQEVIRKVFKGRAKGGVEVPGRLDELAGANAPLFLSLWIR